MLSSCLLSCIVALAVTRAYAANDIKRKPKLIDYRYDINSQNGEDGIIQTIFEVIGARHKKCIEFGAWNGVYLSNTAHLYMSRGWQAILIEMNTAKFDNLIKNVEGKCRNCVLINEAVGIDDHSLDSILKRHGVDNWEFDLLSIDIDGNDYYVFESLVVRPRVVIVEYNPTLPPDLDVLFPYGSDNHLGCSVSALLRIGRQKGYSLVALTEVNAIFVVDEEFHKFSDFETSLSALRIDYALSYLITDYRGRYAVVAPRDFAFPYGLTVPLKDTIAGVNISYFQIQLQL